ncbi:phosphatase PAP2 family protein [Planosporangium thailandense]|uniref:Phosphatase PAP2 family protein n=1 Tax=Planosporangium thailandense TaxID=765197 RepID=A0ABX0Y144_9ACTN|nr:phosphatase PAP2 family protein [Planosporangium thailandense]NJC71187.1 phosphatase PAP2 family protein [Planosporangium thailandense]
MDDRGQRRWFGVAWSSADPRWCGSRAAMRPARWWPDALAAAGFAGLTVALVHVPALLRLDLAVRDWVDAHRPAPVRWLVLVLDLLGQGGPVMVFTLLVGFALAWRHRSVRPIGPAGLAPILTTASIVPLKIYTERGSPHYGPVALFSGPGYVEYPSGHVNNGMVYYGTLALLLAPYLAAGTRTALRWVPPVLVAIGTTYIAYHWLTDSVAGFLLGFVLIRLSLRIPWGSIPVPATLDRRPARPPRPAEEVRQTGRFGADGPG